MRYVSSPSGITGCDARGVLSHSDKLKFVFQHLDKVLRKLCAFGTLSQILEEISDRVYRAGQRRHPGLFTFTFAFAFAFTGFGLGVITSSERFWLDEVTEISVEYGAERRT